jgi:hypothetical protein
MRGQELYLKSYIQKYEGKIIDSVYITKAGILGSAHLGRGKVKEFLDSNGKINKEDGNHTTIKKYMKKFEKMKLTDSFLT